jgi:hypothetical protein
MSREVENYRNGFFLTHHFLYKKNLFGPRQTAARYLVNIVNLIIIITLFNNNTLYQIFFIIPLTYQFHHV